jgi:hypothetical protein
MARWQLTAPHYINVPGTEWEHKEVSTLTGRQIRKIYKVPRLLDPSDGADHTPLGSGVTIVCREGKGLPTDIVFEGDPTPDMTPMDDEAERISAEMRPRWEHPIESLPAQGALAPETLLMMETFAKQIGAAIPQGNASVSRAEFDQLKKMLEAVSARNAELEKQVKRA